MTNKQRTGNQSGIHINLDTMGTITVTVSSNEELFRKLRHKELHTSQTISLFF